LSAIDACDLRAQDVRFCESSFDARTWVSSSTINKLEAPGTYDLIWLGSVITHLSSINTQFILDKMLSWTNIGGIIVMSFHGRFALQRQDGGSFRYIHDAGWAIIKAEYDRIGFGYCDYEGQIGYGISVIKLSWMSSLVEARSDSRLVTLVETAWDAHHDIIAIQKIA
jgi:hypothetical protein